MSSGDTALSDLVAQCLALLEDGVVEIPFDEVCAEHPHLENEVKESVRMATQLPEMHLAGPGVDGRIRSVIGNRYMVRERVGSGAMGVVYAATDMDLGREVALKVMQTGIIQHSTALARFEREASALAAVQHEAIVTIYDRGVTEDGMSFLVMELVDGVPCSDILDMARAREVFDDDSSWLTKECGISGLAEASFLRQVMRWTAEVASGLAAAHAAGVVHRDVKPSNIIIRPDGRAVLLDFGIAAKEDQDKLTQTGATVGTPAYMAPEALMGKPEAMPSQDVYGLAATLYHFLTLEAPYRGGAHEVLSAIATREPIPAVKVRPGLPRDAQAILDHGLARDPASRYASLGAMESDIRALLDYRPVSVRPTGTPTRVWRRVKRSRMAIGAAAASVLLLTAYGAHTWRVARQTANSKDFAAAWEAIPANIGVYDPENRRIDDPEVRRRVADAFDQLVESGIQPVMARGLRSVFRFDQGDADGALADMEVASKSLGQGFGSDFMARYRSMAENGDLVLDEIHAPTTGEGRYLLAFHLMRNGDFGEAIPMLNEAETATNRHVLELRILADAVAVKSMARRNVPTIELNSAAKNVIRRVNSLFAESDYRGATALHATTIVLLAQFEDPETLLAAQELLTFSPHSYVTLENGALAATRLGMLSVARDMVLRALRIVPEHRKLHYLHARIEALAGNFDKSVAIINGLDFSDTPAGREDRAKRLAFAEEQLAYTYLDSDHDKAVQASERIAALAEDMRPGSRVHKDFTLIVKSLQSGDRASLFSQALHQLVDQPTYESRIAMIAKLWPETLDAEHEALLQQWLGKYANVLATQSTVVVHSALDN